MQKYGAVCIGAFVMAKNENYYDYANLQDDTPYIPHK